MGGCEVVTLNRTLPAISVLLVALAAGCASPAAESTLAPAATQQATAPALSVKDLTHVRAADGTLTFQGKVVNGGAAAMKEVVVTVKAYDAAGGLVATESKAMEGILSGGATATFTLTFGTDGQKGLQYDAEATGHAA